MTIKIDKVPLPIIRDEIEIKFGLGSNKNGFPQFGTPTARRDRDGVWSWIHGTEHDLTQIVLDEVLALKEELSDLQLRKGM